MKLGASTAPIGPGALAAWSPQNHGDWFPAALKATLIRRFEFTPAGVIVDGDGNVSNVIDLVSGTLGATIPDDGSRPTWNAASTSGINTRPSASFDGIQNYAFLPSLGTSIPAIYAVLAAAPQANAMIFDGVISTNRLVAYMLGGTTGFYFSGTDTTTRGPLNVAALTSASGSVVQFAINGAVEKAAVDATTATGSQPIGATVIGALTYSAAFNLTVPCAQESFGIFAFSAPLSSGDDATLRAAFASHFNIT